MTRASISESCSLTKLAGRFVSPAIRQAVTAGCLRRLPGRGSLGREGRTASSQAPPLVQALGWRMAGAWLALRWRQRSRRLRDAAGPRRGGDQ